LGTQWLCEHRSYQASKSQQKASEHPKHSLKTGFLESIGILRSKAIKPYDAGGLAKLGGSRQGSFAFRGALPKLRFEAQENPVQRAIGLVN
jgi:hypothetical protein